MTLRPTLCSLLTVLWALQAISCAPSTPEETAPAPQEEPAAESQVRSYSLRGEVQELPDPDDPLSGFYIRHEAVDDFVGMDGEIVGMDAMAMPFPVSDDLDLSSIEVGDIIRFTLEVDWDGDPPILVTTAEKLPADTELEFRKAEPSPGE